MNGPSCTDCGNPLSKRTAFKIAAGQAVTGQCRPCWLLAKRLPQPTCSDCSAPITHMSKLGRCQVCARRRTLADPAFEARRLDALRLAMRRPEVRAIKLHIVAMLAERRSAWCPPHLRDEYRRLRNRWASSVKARAHIQAQMTTFERQLAMVQQGKARIVEVVPIRAPGPERTLGGVVGEIN